MYIIHMCAIISLITNGMFPKALLPNASPFTRQNLGPYQFHIRQGLRKSFFYSAPAARIIRIIFGQRPYAMHVVRQNNPCIGMKRLQQASRMYSGAERFDFPNQQVRPAVCQAYREEIRSSSNAVAAIAGVGWVKRSITHHSTCPALIRQDSKPPPKHSIDGLRCASPSLAFLLLTIRYHSIPQIVSRDTMLFKITTSAQSSPPQTNP